MENVFSNFPGLSCSEETLTAWIQETTRRFNGVMREIVGEARRSRASKDDMNGESLAEIPNMLSRATPLPDMPNLGESEMETSQISAKRRQAESDGDDNDGDFQQTAKQQRTVKKRAKKRQVSTGKGQLKTSEVEATGEKSTSAQKSPNGEKGQKWTIPVVVHCVKDWCYAQAEMKSAGISTDPEHLKCVSLLGQGIKVQFKDTDHFRWLVNLLTERKCNFNVFRPAAEKPLKVVIRGLPYGMDVKVIQKDLEVEQKLPVLRVAKLKNGREDTSLAYVEVEKSDAGKKVYELKAICGLRVSVEAKRRPMLPIMRQCYNCQLFGHTASSCHSVPYCMKCSQQHNTRNCKLARDVPATCINCKRAGRATIDHASRFRGCPSHPLNARNKNAAPSGPARLPREYKTVQPGCSYSAALTGSKDRGNDEKSSTSGLSGVNTQTVGGKSVAKGSSGLSGSPEATPNLTAASCALPTKVTDPVMLLLLQHLARLEEKIERMNKNHHG